MTTTINGSHRAIVPIGQFEKVMLLDIVSTIFLCMMAVGDLDRCEEMGIFELIEEDLGLCTFVDLCKSDFFAMLWERLDQIAKEG